MASFRKIFFLLSLAFVLPVAARPLSYSVFDVPFNFDGKYIAWPSMEQAVEVTNDFYELGHSGVYALWGREEGWGPALSVVGFDILTMWVPFAGGWLHEEWHRSVLSRHHYSSYNDFYNFPFFSDAVSVSHVQDQDLVELKSFHPADHVRLQSAGWESQWVMNDKIEKDLFFNKTRSSMGPMLWFNNIQNSAYLFHCASTDSNASTDTFNAQDGSDILKRDFTGLDCTGWVYDLFKPDEPYAQRGIHPSGVGINRYRKFSDLSNEEQSFLKTTAALSLLNFIDPFLFGLSPFKSRDAEWTIKVKMLATSFGYSIGETLFWNEDKWRFRFTLYQQSSPKQFFPAVEAEIDRYPINWLGEGETLSGRVGFWFQPENQRFDSRVEVPGGILAVTLSHPLGKNIELLSTIEAKTEGWVAGNVYLDKNLSARLGLSASVF